MSYTLLKTKYNTLFWCKELNKFFLIDDEEREKITINKLIIKKQEEAYLPAYLNLVWRITTKCNLSCPHCFSRKDDAYQSQEKEIREKVLDVLLSLCPPKLNFTGGEPILITNFLSILEKLKQKDIILTLTSNGLELDQHFDRIRDYVDWFIISIDHYIPEIHDSLRMKKDIFQKAVNVIKKLVASQKMTRINSVISKKNIDDMEDMVIFFKSLNINSYELIQFLAKNNAYKIKSEYAVDEKLFLNKANELKEKYETEFFKIKINANSTFKEYMIIENDGYLYTIDSNNEYKKVDIINNEIIEKHKYSLPLLDIL